MEHICLSITVLQPPDKRSRLIELFGLPREMAIKLVVPSTSSMCTGKHFQELRISGRTFAKGVEPQGLSAIL